jgi:hypothetical protein
MRLDFLNRALPYISSIHALQRWDWYFFMQHYSVPTRSLDWTESALVALYFALYSRDPGRNSDPAVWVLEPHRLNAISTKRSEILAPCDRDFPDYLPVECHGHITGRLPIAIYPRRTDRRMTAQHSTFTLHGNIPTALEHMHELRQLLDKYLVRVLIDISDGGIDRFKRDLTTLGIRNSSVFPDLEGIAKDICEDYV